MPYPLQADYSKEGMRDEGEQQVVAWNCCSYQMRYLANQRLETQVRKLKIIEHISLDGVIQGPGGRDEDPAGGFKHGGWAMQYQDELIHEAFLAAQGDNYDLLLGRITYDIWAAYWPQVEHNPIADAFNAATKFVATHRPDSLAWGPARDLGRDIVAGLQSIKAEAGPDLVLWGSSTLTLVLLEQGLADEVHLIVYPLILGQGKRFFGDNGGARKLRLVSSKAGASGVVVNSYNYAGSLDGETGNG